MEIFRLEKAAEQQRNAENGNFGDVDYQRLVSRCFHNILFPCYSPS